MTGPISPDGALRSALDALTLRQRVIAANIANADTPGFKASEVRFEDLLVQALRQGRTDVQPEIATRADTSLRADGNNVDVEEQMLALSETALTFTALSRLAGARLALLRSAISEGRR